MYNEKIENLIKAALADGVLTEKEKQILFKNAQAQGIDLDEFEMVLDARLVELEKAEKEKAAKSAPKSDKYGDVRKCPVCGALVPALAVSCAECGYEFSNIGTNFSSAILAKKLIDADNAQYELPKNDNMFYSATPESKQMMIDKLNEHKERVFVMMDKHEEEKALIHYNMNKQNKNKFNKKNRLYKVEHNSVFNYKRLNKSISPTTAMTVHNQQPIKKHKHINVSNITNSINTHHRPFESISTSREVILPKLNVKPYVAKHINNTNTNSTNNRGIYSKKFKQQFLYANLYDNVFDSYVTPTALTSRKLLTLSGSDDDKSGCQSEIVKRNKRMIELSPSFDHCKTESNEMNLIDCLIMDRFNSCYSIALNNINSGSSSNNNTHRIKYN